MNNSRSIFKLTVFEQDAFKVIMKWKHHLTGRILQNFPYFPYLIFLKLPRGLRVKHALSAPASRTPSATGIQQLQEKIHLKEKFFYFKSNYLKAWRNIFKNLVFWGFLIETFITGVSYCKSMSILGDYWILLGTFKL